MRFLGLCLAAAAVLLAVQVSCDPTDALPGVHDLGEWAPARVGPQIARAITTHMPLPCRYKGRDGERVYARRARQL